VNGLPSTAMRIFMVDRLRRNLHVRS